MASLDDDDFEVRKKALEGLGRVLSTDSSGKATDELISLLDTMSIAARKNAEKSLRTLNINSLNVRLKPKEQMALSVPCWNLLGVEKAKRMVKEPGTGSRDHNRWGNRSIHAWPGYMSGRGEELHQVG